MAGPGALTERTTTGELATAGVPVVVTAVVLTAGADAASVVLRDGGAGGTVRLTLKAAANSSVPVIFPSGVVFGSGVHVTLTGTSPTVSVAYG